MDEELHRVVVTAIIYKPDLTYFIAKRAIHKKVQPGKWSVPGGGLSTDDYINTPVSTKESGLTFIRPDSIPVLCLSYFAPHVSGEVILDDEATEYAWVTAEEAKAYDLIEGILGEIQEVDAILRNRNPL